MRRTLEAVYENGVLRPLQPLGLSEHQHVAVEVSDLPAAHSVDEVLDLDYLRVCAPEADNSISLEAVREALSSIPEALTFDFAAERDEAQMPDYFFDSSALAKNYHVELGTPEVERILPEPVIPSTGARP